MHPPTPLHGQAGSLFQRLFGHLMKIIRLLGSSYSYNRASQSLFKVSKRLFACLKKLLVASLLYLPGRHHRKVLDQEKAETSIDKPVVERKTRRKALLIGVKQVRQRDPDGESAQESKPSSHPKKAKAKSQSKKQKRETLHGPHDDVRSMRSLLEEVYHYDSEDITVLIDDDSNDPNTIQPTRENILIQIHKLVEGAKEDDRFFFHFAGHSGQVETDDPDEEDGLNEFILTSDGEPIMDDELKKFLVDPLPVTCSLIAVFDSCHSCSLLDLVHHRCNRVYVPWCNKGHRRTDSLWAANSRQRAMSTRSGSRSNSAPLNLFTALDLMVDSVRGMAMQNQAVDLNPQNEEPSPADLLKASQQKVALSILTACRPWQNVQIIESPTASPKQYSSPITMYCTGHCRKEARWRKDNDVPMADVICLSSSKDSQLSWEDINGNSMTQDLVKILRAKPHRTLHEVLTLVSHDIHTYYLVLHDKAKEYKKELKAFNKDRECHGKAPVHGKDVEMHNFQNPQISSHRPLNMKRIFDP